MTHKEALIQVGELITSIGHPRDKEALAVLRGVVEENEALKKTIEQFGKDWNAQRDRAIEAEAKLQKYAGLIDRPFKTICLCGSTRFTADMLVVQWELTKQGHVVLSWCALPDNYPHQGPHVGDAEGVKEIVDEVHKRKIDLSDEVFVINVGGYIGDSTKSEVRYAHEHGKPIHWLEPDHVEENFKAALAAKEGG